MTTLRMLLAVLLSTALLTACGGPQESAPAETEPAPAAQEEPTPAETAEEAVTAHAKLTPRDGMDGFKGLVSFVEANGVVTVSANVEGLSGSGTHGFHIHETGDCSAPDFTSAGGHFNPADTIHGGPDDQERHAGDLGNLEIEESGKGSLQRITSMITLGEGPNSVVGKAVILHEKADDLVSQPTGAAGGRIACGIIDLHQTELDAMDDQMIGEDGALEEDGSMADDGGSR